MRCAGVSGRRRQRELLDRFVRWCAKRCRCRTQYDADHCEAKTSGGSENENIHIQHIGQRLVTR